MSNAENLMTVGEVAARWKLGHLAIRRRILDGKLDAVKLGRFVRIPLASVLNYERTEFTPMVATPTPTLQADIFNPAPAITTTPEPITTTTPPPVTTPTPPPVDYSREARQARRRRVVAVCGDAVRAGKLTGKELEKLALDAGIISEAGTPLVAETLRSWVRSSDRKGGAQ